MSPFRDSSDRCLISPMPSTNTSDYSTLESFQVDLLLPFNCSFPASPGYWRFVSSSLSLFLSIRLFARSNEIADIYIYIYNDMMVGEKFYWWRISIVDLFIFAGRERKRRKNIFIKHSYFRTNNER